MSEKIVQFKDLEQSDYDLYLDNKYEGKYFTGTAISDEDGIHSEYTYVDGNGHGRWIDVFSNGQLNDEIFLDDGKVISEKIWNRQGQLLYRFEREPLLEQKFDADGHLLKERTKEHKWTFYNNGTKHEDYDYVSSQVTVFDDSGVWIVKGILIDGHWAGTLDTMTFNDDRWSSNYLSILKADYEGNYPYFHMWLNSTPEMRSEIICSLIENEDLRFKYDGLNLALEYGIQDAIPVIEKLLTIKKFPLALEHSIDPMFVVGHARLVLDDFKRSSQETIVLKLASEKESFSDMDAKEALNISIGRTIILLLNMTKKGQLQRISKGRYRLNSKV